jgi:DNA-binding transcriptional LysR family regulator
MTAAAIDLQILRAFVLAAKEGSVSRAAERLHLTQPAVSLQLKRFAEETGLALFTRTPHGLALTADGAAMLPQAERVLAAVGDLQQAARKLQGTVRGALRIGTILDPEFTRLGVFLRELVEAAPQIETELRHGMSGSVLAQVLRGDLDVGFHLDPGEDAEAADTPRSRSAPSPASPTAWSRPPAGARRCRAATGRRWPRCPGSRRRPSRRTTGCWSACSRRWAFRRGAWRWSTRRRRCSTC